jgi:hypothetical protein
VSKPSQITLPQRQSRTPKVVEVLSKHRGVDVTTAQLMEETGFDRQTIYSAMNHLIKRTGLNITIVVPSNVYRYELSDKPQEGQPVASKPTKRLFEELAVTKQGVIVAQDEQGILYTVTEM